MKKVLEIKFGEEGRNRTGAPEKRGGKQRAADYNREKISEQFGGMFQGR